MAKEQLYTVSVISFIVGAILIICMVLQYQKEKTDHDNTYQTTSAKVLNVTRGDYTCYKQVDCNKCAQAGVIDSGCDTLIAEKKTGSCRGGQSQCCQESCYRQVYDKNAGRYNYYFCGPKNILADCYFNCYCSNVNPTPACRVISGQCYNPSIKVSFYDHSGTEIVTSAYKECGINDLKCANNFINGISIGSYIDIEYDIDNPYMVYLGEHPKFKPNAGTVVGIVFGVLFAVAGICFAVAAEFTKEGHYQF
jgi:hypothetical protein